MKKYPFLDLAEVNAPYMNEMVAAAERVIRSGRYIGGEEVEAFEEEMSQLTGAPYIIGVSNGLDALRLILKAYIELGRLKEGDEVIVPANTYIASFLAISDAGLEPVPVDIDPATLNLDSSQIEGLITPRTKAIMTVHLYGRIALNEKLLNIVRNHNLLLIEDSAQAIGARSALKGLNGKYSAGALGHAAAFSFYPTKNTGALGDAGAVATHDEELAVTVRALANYGAERRYHNLYKGYNCRLDPIQAAMLRVKLPYTNKENADRFERALVYEREIKRDDIVKPLIPKDVNSCIWHQYVIRVKNNNRNRLQAYLDECGVGTDIHYAIPPHLQPCYSNLRHGSLPETEKIANEILSLPIATGTTVSDAAQIAKIINNAPF